AILFGKILGGAEIASSEGNLLWIILTVVAIACIGYLFSRSIVPQKVAAPDLAIDWNFIRTSFQTITYAKSLPLVFTI
ncbi:MFS transporter, partial [Acinetobacter baumannii]